MAKRNSPMKAKVMMANMREWKKANKLEPAPPKKPRDVYITRSERIRLELSRRFYLLRAKGPEALAARVAFVGTARNACL